MPLPKAAQLETSCPLEQTLGQSHGAGMATESQMAKGRQGLSA